MKLNQRLKQAGAIAPEVVASPVEGSPKRPAAPARKPAPPRHGDAPPPADPLAAAERADDLVLVCVTDVPSVRGLRNALDAIDLLGMTKARRHLVLNRSDDTVGLSAADIEATIGVAVEASVPTSRSIQIAVNQGMTVVQSDPKSPAGKAMANLASHFLDAPAAPAAAPERSRRFSRKDAK